MNSENKLADTLAYNVYKEEYSRFPHSYYVTPLASPPSFPSLPPSQRRYFYIDVSPPTSVPVKATLLLLHGFPDSSYGWRKVISPLSLSGYRLIVPDLLGYGQTSKPKRLEDYGASSMASDLSGLMTHVLGSHEAKFAVVGHDWGSWLAWKLARWIPERLLGVHGICVPYVPPTETFVPIEKVVVRYPQFGYQQFFEEKRSTKIMEDNLDTFLRILFVSTAQVMENDDGSAMTKIFGGSADDTIAGLRMDMSQNKAYADANLLTAREREVFNFLFDPKRGGSFDGPLNWYRTRKVVYDEERALKGKKMPALPAKILCPTLDPVGQSSLAEAARKHFTDNSLYRIEEIEQCGHWALLERPEVVAASIDQWVQGDVLPAHRTLLQKFTSKL